MSLNPARNRCARARMCAALVSCIGLAVGCGGGSPADAPPDRPASAAYLDRLRPLAPAPVAYVEHVAVALADGGAFVMGGNTSQFINTPDVSTSLRYDSVTETFAPGPDLVFSAEAGFTLPVELPDGAFMLVGGGINSGTQLGGTVDGIRATQAFDPATGRFRRVGDLAARHHMGGTATALRDGGVLVAGGDLPASATAERYDPATGRWTVQGAMTVARRGHTATQLLDGRVLITGGEVCCNTSADASLRTAEIYDPATGTFQATGSMALHRSFHAATLLADGRVLVSGGFQAENNGAVADAEIFDPASGQFTLTGRMPTARLEHAAVRLVDGRVLVVSGQHAIETRLVASATTTIYEPSTGQWHDGPTLDVARAASTATLLRSGKVLVFGGADAGGFPLPAATLYE
ncbi:MAG TPA: kelch repeat-containing protein [Burkholderiaceae bacterium]|nr:kelch repeat-containing protein [Burkholderiaceae bacterium]